MGNRYTKTGYSARQVEQLKRYRMRILDILEDRAGKQDSPRAFQYLLNAADKIQYALDESEEWLKS
jgi:hypothetical protein